MLSNETTKADVFGFNPQPPLRQASQQAHSISVRHKRKYSEGMPLPPPMSALDQSEHLLPARILIALPAIAVSVTTEMAA